MDNKTNINWLITIYRNFFEKAMNKGIEDNLILHDFNKKSLKITKK